MNPKLEFSSRLAGLLMICGVLAWSSVSGAPGALPAGAARGSATAQAAERSQRATNVIGSQVYARTGHERIGQIEDLVIGRSGKVSLAVLTLRPNAISTTEARPRRPATPGSDSSTGPAPAADRLYAVPWSALRYDESMQHFVLDAAADKLASAPSFTRTSWPDMSDERWNQNVYRHYGRRYETASAGSDSGRRR